MTHYLWSMVVPFVTGGVPCSKISKGTGNGISTLNREFKITGMSLPSVDACFFQHGHTVPILARMKVVCLLEYSAEPSGKS